MNITPNNLASAPINWALLPKNIQAEKANLELYQEFYNEDAEIKETVDKLIAVINKTHAVKTPTKATPKKRVAKGKVPITKRKAPATVKKKRSPRKTKKATKPRAKAKPRKAKKVAKPKTKAKAAAPKAPVTVKKLSLELQLIKAFAAMQGKSRKVVAIKNYLKKAEAAKSGCNVPTQKTILTQIITKIKGGLKTISSGTETLNNITLTPELLAKCKAAVKNAKPRLQVQYLAGLKGKK